MVEAGRTFRHSGKLGDIIYSLPTVKAFPGSTLYLNPDRQHMDMAMAKAVLPLLRRQPYIGEARVWSGEPFQHDLDLFRRQNVRCCNLADCHLRSVGLPLSFRNEAWIEVGTPPAAGPEIVVARSVNHHGNEGFWEQLYPLIAPSAVFAGSPAEYEAFVRDVGRIPYRPTADLLEAAELIAGCRLFVGNQTCLSAIAEGLKKPLVLEVHAQTPNCIFYRPFSYPVWHGNQLPGVIDDLVAQGCLAVDLK